MSFRRWLVFAIALAGCAAPTQTYVANKSVGTYFVVPNTWYQVSNKALDKYEFDQIDSVESQARYDAVVWQEAFAPVRVPAKAVLASLAQDEPVAYVRVRTLTTSERNAMSLNGLRDLVFPVTSLIGNTTTQTPVNLLADREVSHPGATGVDTTYEIKIGEQTQRLRQISLLSSDRSTIYLFVVRCSTNCFKRNSAQIKEIAQTFTVRGNRG